MKLYILISTTILSCSPGRNGERGRKRKAAGPFGRRRFDGLQWTALPYQLNLKRTWMLRGSMFWVETVAGMTLPKAELPGDVLILSRP